MFSHCFLTIQNHALKYYCSSLRENVSLTLIGWKWSFWKRRYLHHNTCLTKTLLSCAPCALYSDKYFQETLLPHAWKGGIGCMVVGLAIMVLTVLLSILTPCFRHCCCCSVFTFSGSLQVFTNFWPKFLNYLIYFMFRALLLCSSQWGWWPTLQAGDPLRFHNSTSFHKIAKI